MLILPHFLTGVAISQGIPEAAPAALVAVTSHFVLDAIPHRDTIGGHHLNTANIILGIGNIAIALTVWYWLVPPATRWYALGIGLIATLPDILELPGVFFPQWQRLPLMKQFHHWHTAVLQYSHEPKGWVMGLLPQLVVVGVMFWYLAK